MNRPYKNTESSSVEFFTGREVEHSPMFGQQTLFVVGLKNIKEIKSKLDFGITHIYFGANQSFNPETSNDKVEWKKMIRYFLNDGYNCTLDFDVRYVEFISKTLLKDTKFYPMISVKIPNLTSFHNATVKFDDISFNKTNKGVYCMPLDNIYTCNFTTWSEYTNDEPV